MVLVVVFVPVLVRVVLVLPPVVLEVPAVVPDEDEEVDVVTPVIVGKDASLAIPQLLSLFRDIMMYPSIPQLVPQLFFTNQ